MIVNPNLLLEGIRKSFKSYMNEVQNNNSTFQSFKDAIRSDFKKDIKRAKRNL